MSAESFKDFDLLPEVRKALEKFLRLEITSDELKKRLARVARFTVTEAERKIEPFFRPLQPGILVSKWHIENALNTKRVGQITESELAEWAAIVLLLSDAYEFESVHEDEVADWLNDLSWLPAQEQD